MKKILLTFMLIVLFCLSGCKQEESVKDEPITILTTSIDYEALMNAFHEKYPDIEVEFISYKGFNQTGYIRECLEDGELPDIITTTFFVDEELQKERMLDLSKYSFVNNYTDYWLNKCNVEGSIYLLPSNYSAIDFIIIKLLWTSTVGSFLRILKS